MHIRPFEIGLIAFFVIAAIGGLFLLSKYTGENSVNSYGESVEIWGTVDELSFLRILNELKNDDEDLSVVQYHQRDPRTFDDELVNAIAEGRSPDLILIPHTKLVKFRTKLQPISYESISERYFYDTYIDGAEIFMLSDGVYGIPLAVDPLVMFWNRDLFSANGLAQPPRTWDELMTQTTQAITKINTDRSVVQSAIAFGEYTNVSYAKEILAMLMLQAGSTLVDEVGGTYRVSVNASQGNSTLNPGEAAVTFYTQFALSNKELYSWNRSKESDRKEFLKGDLGLYFAPASEYYTIERDNVNLNFDITRVPQDLGAIPRTYGDFYALSIPRQSDNFIGAYKVALLIASAGAEQFSNTFHMTPALRSLHASRPGSALEGVAYAEALIARGWLDPDPEKSSAIFRRMIEKITSRQERVLDSVQDAIRELSALF